MLVPPAISASPLGAPTLGLLGKAPTRVGSALVDAPVGSKVLGTLVHTSGLLVKAPMRVGSASVGVLDGGRAPGTLLQPIVLPEKGAILQAQSSLAVSLEKVSEGVESGIAASDMVMGVAPSLASSPDSIPVGACGKEAVSFGYVIPLVELDIGIVEGVEGLVEYSLEDSLDLGIAKDSESAQASLEVFNSPHSLEKSTPLVMETDLVVLELELYAVEEPFLLLCCPVLKFFEEGPQSSESVLQLVEELSHYVGLSCDGYVG